MTVLTRSAVPQNVSERTRALLTRLNVYYAGVAVLALVNLYLLIHIVFAWQAASGQNAAAMEQQTVAMRAAEIAKKPLEGLDAKLAQATGDADRFYEQRLPSADSDVVAELGILSRKQGVKLMRGQYVFAPVLTGSSHELTEMRMDASLSGDYKPLMLFINSLERDKMFFLVRGVTLTGEQGGTVGLRLGLVTYLRAPAETEKSGVIPSSDAATGTRSPASGGASR